jgi:hypothetical protein
MSKNFFIESVGGSPAMLEESVSKYTASDWSFASLNGALES